MHVFLFSDHVSERDEVELKRRGAELGLLVMGPGCGTAMLGEVGLGFANVVRSGSVGIVAAAGTGAQEAASLLDGADGRRLADRRRGRARSDRRRSAGSCSARRCGCSPPTTARTRCCSSPSRPSREVVQKLGEVDVNGKRVVAAFVGWDAADAPFEIHPTLDAGAFAAAGVEAPDDRRSSKRWSTNSASAASSSASTPAARSPTRRRRSSATATRSSTWARRSTRRAARTRWSTSACGSRCSRKVDDDVGCVLLDVVIGHGSHPDPASELAPVLKDFKIPVIAHVCGTDADPQDASRQEETLRNAGVIVAPTNAAAARLAARAL